MADVRLEFHADIKKSTEALTTELDHIIQDVEKKISPIKLKFDTAELRVASESIKETMRNASTVASQIFVPNTTAYNKALEGLKNDLTSVIKKQRDWSTASKESSGAVSDAYKKLQDQETVIRSMIQRLEDLAKANNTTTYSVEQFRQEQSLYRKEIADTSAVLEEAEKKSKALARGMNPDAYATALSKIATLMGTLDNALSTASNVRFDAYSPDMLDNLYRYIGELDILRTAVRTETVGQKEFAASFNEISANAKIVTTEISNYAKSIEQAKKAESTHISKSLNLEEYEKAAAAVEKLSHTLEAAKKLSTESGFSEGTTSITEYINRLNTLRNSLEAGTLNQQEFKSTLDAIAAGSGNTITKIKEYADSVEQAKKAASELISRSTNLEVFESSSAKIEKLATALKNAKQLSHDINFSDGEVALVGYISRLDLLQQRLESGTMTQQEFRTSLDAISSGSGNVITRIKEYADIVEQAKNASITSGTTEYKNALADLEKELETVIARMTAWSGASVHQSDSAREAYNALTQQKLVVSQMLEYFRKYEDQTGATVISIQELKEHQAKFNEEMKKSSRILEETSAKGELLSKKLNPEAYEIALSKISKFIKGIQEIRTLGDSLDIKTVMPEENKALDDFIERVTVLRERLESENISLQDFNSMLNAISSGSSGVVTSIKEYAESLEQARKANLTADTTEFNNALAKLRAELENVRQKQVAWAEAQYSTKAGAQENYQLLKDQESALKALIDRMVEHQKDTSKASVTVAEYEKAISECGAVVKGASLKFEELGVKSKWISKADIDVYDDAIKKISDLRQKIAETKASIDPSKTPVAVQGVSDLETYDQLLKEMADDLGKTGMAQTKFADEFKKISTSVAEVAETVKSEAVLIEGTNAYKEALGSLSATLEEVTKKKVAWESAKYGSTDEQNAYQRLVDQEAILRALKDRLENYATDSTKAAVSVVELTNAQVEYNKTLKETSQALDGLDGKSKWLSASSSNTEEFSAAVKKVSDMYTQLTNTIEKYTGVQTESSGTVMRDLESYRTELSDLGKKLSSTGMSQKEFAETTARIGAGISNAVSTINEEAAAVARATKNDRERNAVLEQTTKLLLESTKTQAQYASSRGNNNAYFTGLSQNINEIAVLTEKLRTGQIETSKYREEIERLTQSIQVNTTGLQNSATGMQRLGQQIGGIFSGFANFGNGLTQYITMMFSAYRIIYRVIGGIRDLINRSIELEDAMVDLRIVTGITNDEYTEYLKNISDISKATATSLNSLITATTTFSRLGYNIEESSMLAKFTGMLEKVGSVDTEKAQNAVTSIMKAFSKELNADDIEKVLDKLVTVGNNFPISVEQISEAMLNASSTLAAAGNTFEQSVALLTAANATIQNASKSSTGLRTIAARLRNTKAELEALGEEVITTAKYEELVKMLTDHKVALTDINGEYRSTYDIIKDIAAQWDEMSSMEQAALATEIAGVRQQSVFFSLVEQFKEASGAMDQMAESTGALEEAYSVYTDSMTAHIEQFRTAWSTLAVDLVDSSAVKGIVDYAAAIVNVIDQLVRMKMLLPTILTYVSMFQTLNLVRTIQQSQRNLEALTRSIGSASDVTHAMQMQVAALNNNERARLTTMIQAKLQQQGLTQEQINATTAALGLSNAENVEAGASNNLRMANIGLAASFQAMWASNPLGLIMMLTSAITSIYSTISVIRGELSGAETQFDTTTRSISEITEEVRTSYEQMQSTENEIDQLLPRFTKLAKGVDSFGQNVSLTSEEYEEFLKIQNKIAEQIPELDMGLDSNGNHMLKLDYKAEQLNETLEEQLRLKREIARMDAEEGIDEAFDNRTSAIGVLRDDTIDAKDALQAYYDILYKYGSNGTVLTGIDNSGSSPSSATTAAEKVIPFIGKDVAEQMMAAERIYAQTGDNLPLMLAMASARVKLEDHIKAFDDMAHQFTDKQKAEIQEMLLMWAQLSPEFDTIGDQLGTEMENIVSRMILDINPEDFDTSEQIKDYIEISILKPFANVGEESKTQLKDLFNLSDQFQTGEKSIGEFASGLDVLVPKLRASELGFEAVENIMNATGINGYMEKYHTLTQSIEGDLNEVSNVINGLSADDIEIGYQIVAENGSMTLDEFSIKLEQAKLAGGSMKDIFDLSDFFEGTKTLRGGMENIASAMKKLQEGTALTKNEMFKLAEQFPMLLKQSNLFTDGSIEGQKKMLKTVQDVQKQSYQAAVDAKVAELKAAKEAITSQIELEKKKVEILLEANNALIKDKLEGNIKYEKAMAKIDEIEATNYAEIKNGEVNINNAGLKAMSDATAQSAEELLGNVWIPYAEGMISTIGGAYEIMVDAAKDAYEAITAAILSGDDSGMLSSAVMLARAQEGDQEALDNLRSGVWRLSDKAAEIFKNSMNRQISLGRIKVLESAAIDIDNIIENLEASLEDLTYTFADASNEFSKTSGSSSSSSSSSSSNDPDAKYYSAIDALVAYRVKMLRAELEERKKELQKELSLAKDFADYQKKLLDRQYNEEKYRKEQEEKRKAVTDVKLEMDRLSRDNSAWAQGRLVELNEKLKDAQEKLDEFEKKEALETGKEFWETFYANKQTEINDQIDALTDILADNTDFQQQAYSELMSNTTKFANTIYDYARKNETSMDSFYKMFRNVYDAILALQKEDNDSVLGTGTSVWWTGDGLKWLWALLTDPNNYSFSGARYAAGTPNATAGWHRVNEIGAEALFTSVNGKQYRLFSGGERVLDAESTSFLYELAKSRGANLAQTISQTYQSVSARSVPSVVNMGNIVINGNADELTVSQIRRAQRDSVASLLKEFGRLAR